MKAKSCYGNENRRKMRTKKTKEQVEIENI